MTPVYALSIVLAACSILYELVAAQTMSLLAANTVIWYSLVVGTFLAAMGFGSWWSRRFGSSSLWSSLFRVEIAMSLVGGLLVPALHLAHTAHSHLILAEQEAWAGIVFFGTAAVVVACVGTLTGIELPLLMRIARGIEDESAVANTVLGIDYIGALFGALVFPLILVPNLDMPTIGFLIAAVNLVAAAYILLARIEKAKWIDGVGFAGLTLLITVGFVSLGSLQQYFLQRYYNYLELTNTWIGRFEPRPDLPEILRWSSAYQKIDLMLDTAPGYAALIMPAYSAKLERYPDYPSDYILSLNGDFQANTRAEEIYHEWFAHVPIILNGEVPRNVLVLGGGDGLLIRELLKYEGIERITHVDLDPVLVELASTQEVLRGANRGALLDPRVHTIIGDGYQFVRNVEEIYDAIFIDFPVPKNYDLAKLYSREFYHFVRNRIAPNGFAVFDSAGTGRLTSWGQDGKRWPNTENDWPVYYNTLRKTGFPTIVPFLSILERDNERATEILDARIEANLRRLTDPAEREQQAEILRARASRVIDDFVSALSQGFIMVTPEARELSYEFEDPGVELLVLDERRFRLAFSVDFPQPAEIVSSRVNSILRPTFPTVPWWKPRLPF